MSETKEAIAQMYRAMGTIARNGGYIERKELLEVLDACSWFDNFGYELYQQRIAVVQMIIEQGMKNEDIPEIFKETLEIE